MHNRSGQMASRTARAARIAAIVVMAGATVQVAQVHAAEGGFLEMLFGVRPAPQPAPAVAPVPGYQAAPRRLGSGRHRLKTRYAALPVKIRVSERQKPLDMSQGAAAALLRDETLRPGDIVVFKTGAQVFAGSSGRQHTMGDFEPVKRSAHVDKKTRKLLAAMTEPAGTLPADEARRMVARLRKNAPAEASVARSAEMRVINPWRTAP
jgi:hypothetical protein